MTESVTTQSIVDSTSGAVKFECGICLNEFSTLWCLQMHIKTHTEESITCDESKMTFSGYPKVSEQLNLHTFHPKNDVQKGSIRKIDTLASYMYEKTETSQPGLSNEKSMKRSGSDKNLQLKHRREEKKKPFKCQMCGLRFTSRNAMMIHLKTDSDTLHNSNSDRQHRKTKLRQEPCLIPARSQLNFQSRKGRNAKHCSDELNGRDMHRCRVCRVVLPRSMKLKRAHIRKHLLVKPNKRVYHVWKYLKVPVKGSRRPKYRNRHHTTGRQYSNVNLSVPPPLHNEGITPDSGVASRNCVIESSVVPKAASLLVEAWNHKEKIPGDREVIKQNMLQISKQCGWYRCNICSAKLKRKKDFKEHLDLRHIGQETNTELNPDKELTVKRKSSPWYTCTTCGVKIRGRKTFTAHLKLPHTGNDLVKVMKRCRDIELSGVQGSKHGKLGPWFRCNTCGKRVRGRRSLVTHFEQSHLEGHEVEAAEKPGDLVSNASETPSNLAKDQHKMASSIHGKPWKKCCSKQQCAWFRCNTCDVKFKGKGRIRSHVEICQTNQSPNVSLSKEANIRKSHFGHDIPDSSWFPCSKNPRCSWYVCGICGTKVHGKKRLCVHSLMCQGGHTPAIIKPSKENRGSIISSQKKTRTSSPDLEINNISESGLDHGAKWYKCLLCSKLIEGKAQMEAHKHDGKSWMVACLQKWDTHYRSVSGILFVKSVSWFQCQLCRKMIRGRLGAENHSHTNDESIAGSQSDVTYLNSNFLRSGRKSVGQSIGQSVSRESHPYNVRMSTNVDDTVGSLTVENVQSAVFATGRNSVHKNIGAENDVNGSMVTGGLAATRVVTRTTESNLTSDNKKSAVQQQSDENNLLGQNMVGGPTGHADPASNFVKKGPWYKCRKCGKMVHGKRRMISHGLLYCSSVQSKGLKLYTQLQLVSSGTSGSSSLSDQQQNNTERPTKHVESESNVFRSVSELGKTPESLFADTRSGETFVKSGTWYKCTKCMVSLRGKKRVEAHSHYNEFYKDVPKPLIPGQDKDGMQSTIPSLSFCFKGKDMKTSEVKQYWKCKLCAKVFANKSDLSAHLKNHQPCERFVCSECNKSFVTWSGLKLHMRMSGRDHGKLNMDCIGKKDEIEDQFNKDEDSVEEWDRVSGSPFVSRHLGGDQPCWTETNGDKAPVTDLLCSEDQHAVVKPKSNQELFVASANGTYVVHDESLYEGTDETQAKVTSEVNDKYQGWKVVFESDGVEPVESSDHLPALDYYGKMEGQQHSTDENSDPAFISPVRSHFQNKMKNLLKKGSGVSSDDAHLHSPDYLTSTPRSESISFALKFCGQNSSTLEQTRSDCSLGIDSHSTLSRDPKDHYIQQDNIYLCKICSKQCLSKSSIIIHIRSHFSDRQLKCQTCGFVASSWSNLKKHVLNKHTFSPATTRKISQQVNTYVSNDDDESYKCDICSKKFARKDQVKQHVRRHLMKQCISEKYSQGRLLNDQSERASFESKQLLVDNGRPASTETHQSDSFSTKSSGGHIGQTNSTEKKSDSQKKPFKVITEKTDTPVNEENGMARLPLDHQCLDAAEDFTCDQETTRQVTKDSSNCSPSGQDTSWQRWSCVPVQHIENFHCLVKGEFSCQICFKRFATKLTATKHLTSHFRTSSNTTVWRACESNSDCLQALNLEPVCRLCGDLFQDVGALTRHEKSHADTEKNRMKNCQDLHLRILKCSQCSAVFNNSLNLDIHCLMKKHYVCECGKVFVNFSKLELHRKQCSD